MGTGRTTTTEVGRWRVAPGPGSSTGRSGLASGALGRGRLVLLRHGETDWNVTGRCTGWADPPLSAKGEEQARQVGRALAVVLAPGAVIHTSVLGRAVRTAELVATEMHVSTAEIASDWRLNERHPGQLEGLTKAEMLTRWKRSDVAGWRHDGEERPPPLAAKDPRHPRFDPRYRNLPRWVVPASETRREAVGRALGYWHAAVEADLRSGLDVVVVSHGSLLAGLHAHVEGAAASSAPRSWSNGEARLYPRAGKAPATCLVV